MKSADRSGGDDSDFVSPKLQRYASLSSCLFFFFALTHLLLSPVHASCLFRRAASAPNPSVTTKQQKIKGKFGAPQSLEQEETQLALALSASMVEPEDRGSAAPAEKRRRGASKRTAELQLPPVLLPASAADLHAAVRERAIKVRFCYWRFLLLLFLHFLNPLPLVSCST